MKRYISRYTFFKFYLDFINLIDIHKCSSILGYVLYALLMFQMECLNCKKEFIPTNPNQHYCCNDCYKEYQKVLRKKRDEKNKWFICSECGKEYRTFIGDNQWRLCKECIAKKSICQCGNKKSPGAKYCKACGYKYQKEFVCVICGKTCRGNSNQKICDDCEPECMLPGCNNKIPDYRHRAKTNNLNSLMFCCKQHYHQYEKYYGFPDGSEVREHQRDIGSGKYSHFGEAAAKPRIKRLEDNGIEYETQFQLPNNLGLKYPKDKYKEWAGDIFPSVRNYDIKIGDILIEISPTISHNSTYCFPRRKDKLGRHPLYHAYTQMLAEANGYHCIQIFDFDNEQKIKERLLGLIKGRKSINARIIRRISIKEGNEFCEENHLQGKTSYITNVRYGLFRSDNDKPYAVMGFKFEKGYRTLQRYACLKGYHIPYGAHRLFKQFIKDYNPDYIVSQSDCSKHNGKLYDSLGFERLGYTRDYRYSTVGGNPKHYQRRTCQRKSMYKLPGFENHPKGDIYYSQHKEPELMKMAGYAWLVTAGLRRHVWFRDNDAREKYITDPKKDLRDKR